MSIVRASERTTCCIVLNWNQPERTIDCLDSISRIKGIEHVSIVVCDNGSTDDSIARIHSWANANLTNVSSTRQSELHESPKHEDWRFLLLRCETNNGYSAGNNAALRVVLENPNFEYVWILNNDTKVEKDSLVKLHEFVSSNPLVGIVGSTLVSHCDKHTIQMAGGCRFYPLLGIIHPLHAKESLGNVRKLSRGKRLDYVSGASMFCRTSVFNDVGLFDESFFIYYEELDFAYRMRSETSWKNGWCVDSIVYHIGGLSTGEHGRSGEDLSELSAYHQVLSTLIFYRKHHVFLMPFTMLFNLGSRIALFIMRRQRAGIPLLIKACLDFLKSEKDKKSTRESKASVIGSWI